MTRALVMLVAIGLCSCSDDESSNTVVGDSSVATPDAGGVATLTRGEVMNACVRASACKVQTYPRLSSCLEAYYDLNRPLGLGPVYDSIFACVNKAEGDCEAVAKCYGWGKNCDSSYKASCEGDVAVSCDLIQRRIYRLDCAKAGLKCGLKSDATSSANCTPGICDQAYKDRCVDTRELICGSGIIEMRDCKELGGMACGQGGGWKGTYGCQGETEVKCGSWGKYKFKPKCEGNIAKTCEGSRVHEVDCFKLTMIKTACSEGVCKPRGNACTSGLNRCNGDNLEACLDGWWKKVECDKLDLGPCKLAATYGANCTNKYL